MLRPASIQLATFAPARWLLVQRITIELLCKSACRFSFAPLGVKQEALVSASVVAFVVAVVVVVVSVMILQNYK